MDAFLDMTDRAVLVMGAGQGIGRAASLFMAERGAKLALVDLERDRVDKVAAEVRELGRPAEPIVANATVESDVEMAVETAVKAMGRVDSLINIIGIASWAPILEIDSAEWDAQAGVNLKQHFFASRAVARRMVEQGDGGTIAVVASVSGMYAAPNHAAYGAAKAGVMALVRSMSQEWEEHGIRVNAVAPGSVLTPRILAMREAGEIPERPPAARNRDALPEDIAKALIFLSSDMARRVTGQTLVVDGGTTARFPFNMDG